MLDRKGKKENNKRKIIQLECIQSVRYLGKDLMCRVQTDMPRDTKRVKFNGISK